MILYGDKEEIKKQIKSDFEELEKYKNSYSKRISLYNTYLDTMQVFEDGVIEQNKLNIEDMKAKKQIFQEQINKINKNQELLKDVLKSVESTDNVVIEEMTLNHYNQEYNEIRSNYINNSVFEEQTTEKYISGLMDDLAKILEKLKEKQNTNSIEEKESSGIQLKNNDTLLISEVQGKVLLPYKAEDIWKIFDNSNNKYSCVEEVIEDRYTRDFSDFRIQFTSRYAETMKLAREKENYNFFDAVILATEMMKKRFLHPAIISACNSLNELDVYLDCLDKNELDDFKIFKIKYELYPAVVKQNHNKKGKRYKKESKVSLLSRLNRNRGKFESDGML